MRKQNRRLTLQACSILFALCLGGNAWAAAVSTLLEDCASCHGKDGASTESDVPIIGGYSAKYLTDSLADYKDKVRPCPEVKYLSGPHKGEAMDMCTVAAKLTDEDVTAIASNLAAKPFVRAKQAFDATKAARGKQVHDINCKKCHEDGGSSPDDDAGILAGQWMPYIGHTFDEYASGKRPMVKKMKSKFDELSKDDRDALLNYFGSFK